jgi:hypothetical protein
MIIINKKVNLVLQKDNIIQQKESIVRLSNHHHLRKLYLITIFIILIVMDIYWMRTKYI